MQRARLLFEQACNADDTEGCFNLGLLYEKGLGVPKDAARAAGFFRKACAGGDAEGCQQSKTGPR
jgi:TPR repeat protein